MVEKLKYLFARLQEAGTWRLIVALAAMAGVQLTDTTYDLVLIGLSALLIIWETLMPDAPKESDDG